MVFKPELIFIKTCITNIILIGGLRGSSIGNQGNRDNFKLIEVIKTILNLFIIFHATKTLTIKSKPTKQK